LSIDEENEYIFFAGGLRQKKEIIAFLSNLKGNFESKIFPIPPTLAHILWNRLHVLRIEKLTGDLDVFHSSDWTQPPSDAFKVTTVHDMVPLRFPQYSHPRIVSAHKARLKWVKKEIDIVIVPSRASKEDLVKVGVPKLKIVVIPEAVDPIFKPVKGSKIADLKRKYRITGKYLLALGVNFRKNTQRIIQAFEKVRAGKDLKLVFIGYLFEKTEQRRGVRFVGHVSTDELPVFYSGAEALVYPSLYEGFGLPILEAFACRTPVVTSNISSLPEVAGGAAELVDPYDTDSIAEGIRAALGRRKGLIKEGLKRVEDFSWEKTAKMTLEVYNEAKR
ncbi:MAG: glycosyltransferase family 1 protein, partial [Microgenomates group bacterium]